MEQLQKEHSIFVDDTDLIFKRHLIDELPWQERLLGIKGFRGVGKTTLILQYIKENYGLSEDVLYVSLDNLYFTNNNLVDFANSFVAKGGKHLFLDEVHKYPNWSIEIKNIYDLHKNLRITFTASSLLEILNSRADLSRRAVIYNMQGLSFREFLNYSLTESFISFSLDDILENHRDIASDILKKIKPLKYFSQYLASGYYPFFKENPKLYYKRIESIVNMVIDIELPLLRDVQLAKVIKIKQLLVIIAQSVPFKPNISKLSERIGVTRNTLVEYIKDLVDTRILSMITKDSTGISLLQKPDKLFLENTNLAFMLAKNNANKGNLRETFFLNQLSAVHTVAYPKIGDFIVDDKYLFEVGGQYKTQKQIEGIKDSHIAADDIEYGFGNKIPLWLFGFLY